MHLPVFRNRRKNPYLSFTIKPEFFSCIYNIIFFFLTYAAHNLQKEIYIIFFYVGGICLTCFVLGLSMMQDSGSYVVQLFDKFSANLALLVIAICEFVSVSWIYGYERYA